MKEDCCNEVSVVSEALNPKPVNTIHVLASVAAADLPVVDPLSNKVQAVCASFVLRVLPLA